MPAQPGLHRERNYNVPRYPGQESSWGREGAQLAREVLVGMLPASAKLSATV